MSGEPEVVPEVLVDVELPGSAVGQALRAEYWDEVAALAGLPGGDDPLAGDLVDLVAPRGTFLVATRGDVALGCVGVREIAGGDVEVKRLFVSSRARGLGLGRRLLNCAEGWARERGAGRLVLDTHGSLLSARGLYVSAGFEEVASYNDNPHAQHWFAKVLG